MRGTLAGAGLATLFAVAPATLGLAPASAGTCTDPMDQSTMNICADKDYRAADAVLNKVYKRAMAAQDDTGRDLLRASERVWIAYRDAECKFEAAPNEGGSIYPMVYAGCLTRLTKARIADLRQGQQ